MPSGVSEQPIGDAETKEGAINRARGALCAFKESHDDGRTPDFAIGMEGGIDGFAIGETMTCFAFIAIGTFP